MFRLWVLAPEPNILNGPFFGGYLKFLNDLEQVGSGQFARKCLRCVDVDGAIGTGQLQGFRLTCEQLVQRVLCFFLRFV